MVVHYLSTLLIKLIIYRQGGNQIILVSNILKIWYHGCSIHHYAGILCAGLLLILMIVATLHPPAVV